MMPPKVKFGRDKVVGAAVAVVEESGLQSLTARRVAAKLGSSTAPVYNHFATMDELSLAVIRETEKILLEYIARPYTDRVFLNMGTGLALFASNHGRLYRALMMEGDSYGVVVDKILATMESNLPRDGRFSSLPPLERRRLLRKMWTFTHGLAALISVGLVKECDQASIVDALVDIGTDVIKATLARHEGGSAAGQGRTDDQHGGSTPEEKRRKP